MFALARTAQCSWRSLCAYRGAASLAYVAASRGDLGAVLSPQKINVSSAIPPEGVHVQWLAAGIDEVDIAAASGASSGKSFAPSSEHGVCGTEGVAVVKSVGSNVTSIQAGDFVIPIKAGVGTWCEEAVVGESQVAPVRNSMRVELAATLSSSPFTAFRLLSDFVKLAPGDVVVQNSGSSAVGTAVVQIAKEFGVTTVSLVNESIEDYAPTVERLKLMGGDVVIGESYVDTPGFLSVMGDLPAPKLALNGSTAQDKPPVSVLEKLIESGGTIVTYSPGLGPKSTKKKSMHKTFSLADWLEKSDRREVESMISILSDMVEAGKLTAWLQRVNFEDLPSAIRKGSASRRKLVAMINRK